MSLHGLATTVATLAAIVATLLGVWGEFKKATLVDKCNDSSIQLVGLVNSCTDWCKGE